MTYSATGGEFMKYSTGQVSDKSGATARQLQTWADKGWLLSKAEGSGKPRTWCESDLQRAILLMRFLKAGFTLEKSYKLMTMLRNREDPRKEARIRVGDDLWVIVKGM